MHAFPCRLTVIVRRSIFVICTEQPNFPVDRAVVRIENEMRSVLALCSNWYRRSRRPRNAQIEEDFLFHEIILLLDMDIVRRGKVGWEGRRRWRLCG